MDILDVLDDDLRGEGCAAVQDDELAAVSEMRERRRKFKLGQFVMDPGKEGTCRWIRGLGGKRLPLWRYRLVGPSQ